ncbi:aminotransferase class V-fold PLP-dependent enzyme [Microbacterium sp. CJ88]|uniref:aminotransferase class V-fold PLP-dependent enzyme n=1 Tax=Microbacterium sp. CJ88 TaxID=3445672 RepID=UPI003F65AAAD
MSGRDAYRAQFAEDRGYLNFASYGPPSRAAVDAATRLMGRAMAGADATRELHSADADAIRLAAQLTGRAVDEVLLVPSTSHGLFQVAFGVTGDVLVSSGEFPSNLYPWWRAEQAGLLRVRALDGASVTPESVATALSDDVAALAVSAVDFRTGFRADLAGLREVLGDRLLIVDAIQGFGVVELPWEVADVLVVGGQKWLRAGWGTGFVALSPRARDRLRPTLGGWTGVVDPGVYDGVEHHPAAGARMLSVTNGSPFASAALAAALELLGDVGVPAVEHAIASHVDHLIEVLRASGVPVVSPVDRLQRAGIVVARLSSQEAAHAHRRLSDAGITTTLHGPDRIRFSVHATTTTAVLDTVGDLMKGPT